MKNCIMLWKNDAVDLAINNQRRAFRMRIIMKCWQKVKFILNFPPKIHSVN